MEKKTLYIIIGVVVIAVIALIAVGIAMGGHSSDNNDKYVTYEGNGGVTSPSQSTSYKLDSDVVDSVRFFKNNYILVSFNDKVDGSGKSYKTGDHVDYGTTLYAQWKAADETTFIINSNNPNYGNYMTIKYDGNTLVSGTTYQNNDCKFTIVFNTVSDTYTFESGSSLDSFVIKEGANTLAEVEFTVSSYTERSHHGNNLAIDDHQTVSTLEGQKTVTIQITFVPT